MRRIPASLLTLLLSGCALSPMMPPLNSSYLAPQMVAAPPPAWKPPPPKPAPVAEETPTPSPKPSAVRIEHDSVDDVTRVSLTTHPGAYFLWVQRPQVTFFYVYAGMVPAESPPVVYLVFRTQSPSDVLDNKLHLVCDGTSATVPGLPTSRVNQTIQTSVHYLTFAIPTETFVRFSECGTAEVEVGGVHAPFNSVQQADLRAFAARLLRT
jgi:hypothetical protein